MFAWAAAGMITRKKSPDRNEIEIAHIVFGVSRAAEAPAHTLFAPHATDVRTINSLQIAGRNPNEGRITKTPCQVGERGQDRIRGRISSDFLVYICTDVLHADSVHGGWYNVHGP